MVYEQTCDAFNRIFYPTCRGNAQWGASTPLGDEGYAENGMELGDLIIRSPLGIIDYVFNVTYPPDHPKNKLFAPPDFQPIRLHPTTDYTVTMDAYPSPSFFGGTNDNNKPLFTTTRSAD